jgi:LmbE family N-acetylglucosaminyl deacetylase
MPTALQISERDRVLVLAPHPDDESIACGGLLLAARDAGTPRRVVVVTDGDNNPWPQRWIEKRWRVDAAARARWGARRRAEVQAALDVLGVDDGERHFLGLPDSGLTGLLMHGSRLETEINAHIEQFRPTHIALPALEDGHPDHSAVHVAARLAVARVAVPVRLLCYAVHGLKAGEGAAVVALSEAQQAAKREAILSHETQMRLSGGRFLRFVRDVENYGAPTCAPRTDSPLRVRFDEQGIELLLATHDLRDAARKLQLLVLVGSPGRERVRLQIPVAPGATVTAQGTANPATLVDFEWRPTDDGLALRIALEEQRGPGFFKLERRRPGLVIYDRYGWQTAEQ